MPTSAPQDLQPTRHDAQPWQLRLLGAVEARRGGQHIRRWPGRAAAALLARLALAPQRAHPREELVDLLWPGVALDVGRNRLRQVLSTLRGLFDDTVIDADRHSIRLRPDSLRCDATDFERLVRAGDWAAAQALYGGELMPGHYDEWVLEARSQLAALHDRVEARAAEAPQAPAVPAVDPVPLPASWTRVFGIEHSATRLRALLRHERLVTVVGPGGCGKTRLALETARALRDSPAWQHDAEPEASKRFARIGFVPLMDCSDEPQAVAAIARALQLSGRDPLQQLIGLLASAPALLVLDNFEQLLPQAQGLLLRLLEAVPRLHLLVTSRLRLGLPGEQVFALGGLALPDAEASARLDAAALNPALALFVDRARAARADYQLQQADLPALCQLVRWLDGMPLALELAASRIGSFTPAQMLQLLQSNPGGDAHLSLLARSGPRAGHDRRQASIAQVIDWSWRLLDPGSQQLLAAVSGFAGDAGLPALAAVLQRPQPEVAARLDDLAGHSMLRVLPGSAPRFALVEPVREFVQAHWPAAALAALQQAQLRWLLHWATALGPAPAAGVVDAELRSVLWLLSSAALPPAGRLELALALRSHWEGDRLPVGVQARLEQALADLTDDPGLQGLRSEVHELLAYQRFEAGFVAEALAHADRALSLAGGHAPRRARALVRRAWIDLAAGRGVDDDGPATQRLLGWLQEALQLARQGDDREAQARALHQLAVVKSHLQQDWVEAEALLARSQAIWAALGDRRKASARLRNRAQCWVELGRTDEALACFERCEQQARDDADWLARIDCLLSRSTLLVKRRQWQEALVLDRQCVALCWQHWHRHGLGYALWNPPLSLARLRRPEPAMRLMAYAATFWEANFGPLARSDRQTVRRVRRLVCAQAGAARTEAWWAEGAAMDIASAVALALQA